MNESPANTNKSHGSRPLNFISSLSICADSAAMDEHEGHDPQRRMWTRRGSNVGHHRRSWLFFQMARDACYRTVG